MPSRLDSTQTRKHVAFSALAQFLDRTIQPGSHQALSPKQMMCSSRPATASPRPATAGPRPCRRPSHRQKWQPPRSPSRRPRPDTTSSRTKVSSAIQRFRTRQFEGQDTSSTKRSQQATRKLVGLYSYSTAPLPRRHTHPLLKQLTACPVRMPAAALFLEPAYSRGPGLCRRTLRHADSNILGGQAISILNLVRRSLAKTIL